MSYERIVILILLLLLAAAQFRPQPVATVAAPKPEAAPEAASPPGGKLRPAGCADGDPSA